MIRYDVYHGCIILQRERILKFFSNVKSHAQGLHTKILQQYYIHYLLSMYLLSECTQIRSKVPTGSLETHIRRTVPKNDDRVNLIFGKPLQTHNCKYQWDDTTTCVLE